MPNRSLLCAFSLALVSYFTAPSTALSQPPGATGNPPRSIASSIPPTWPYRCDTTTASSRGGMVVCDAALATDVGCRILREGGNAIDAAVGTAFALAVVFPAAGNIGGGGFLVARFADGSRAALDFRETAPHAASRTMYLDALGNSTDRSLTGGLASGVPGSVAGLWEAHRKFGSLPWKQILDPAIGLAENGFIVDARFTATVRDDSARLVHDPASRMLFLPEGSPVTTGSLWRNPALARVLRSIAGEGPAGFYSGTTAERIVQTMQTHGGIITRDDLARYVARWRTPISFAYRGDTVISMPLPSSGGVTLALIANIVSGFDLARLGWHSPIAIHLVAESMRRAFADRNSSLGDPEFVRVPLDTLLSETYAARQRATIAPDHATPSSSVTPFREGNNTTHLSVVDSAGNAVALTTTLNLLYGSAVTVDGGGFLLNDEMDDFATKPGSPNVFGLVQGDANAIAPGKRILSSMTPTIVVDTKGRTLLVTGASGGPRIISAVFQVISNIVDYGFSPVQAINAPRFHHQHLPDRTLPRRTRISPCPSLILSASSVT